MLKRFGVSLEEDLLKEFDKLIERRGYTNRSEAIRDLIRDDLIKTRWQEEETETAGVAVLVYDHHQHELANKLTKIQHADHDSVISTLHVHLDAHYCLEVILLKGRAKDIRKTADYLISTKGVLHGQFVRASTGREIKS